MNLRCFILLVLWMTGCSTIDSKNVQSIKDMTTTHSQTSDIMVDSPNQELLKSFIKAYNYGNHDEFFEQFDDAMQQALPKHDMIRFFEELKAGMGDVTNIRVYTPNFYAVTFAKGNLAMMLSQQNGMITELMFVPDHHISATNHLTKNSLNEKLFDVISHAPNGTQIALSLIDGKDVRHHGVRRHEDAVIPSQNHEALFEIGSITKTLTATVLADMVINNQLELTDSINDYYPNLNAPNIEFLTLANHTSGLPRLPKNFTSSNPDNPYQDYDVAQFEQYVMNEMAEDLPSMSNTHPYDVNYSNLGYALLGNALARAEEEPLSMMFHEKIFKRYDMNDTHTDSHAVLNHPKLVKGQNINGEIVSHWQTTGYLGAGGVVSSVSDLSKFAQAHFGSDPALSLSRRPTTLDGAVALAWHISPDDDGWVWHDGQTGGYSSFMAIHAADQKAIILLTNIQGDSIQSGFVNELGFHLMK